LSGEDQVLPKALLRPPPLPGLAVRSDGSKPPAVTGELPDAAARKRLFTALRDARVGGAFWGAPAHPTATPEAQSAGIVIRTNSPEEGAALRADYSRKSSLVFVRQDDDGDVDPWSILPGSGKLVAHGDDEWVALATVIGKPVQVLSPGGFGAPEDGLEQLANRALSALCKPMRDPFSEGWLSPEAAIALLADWRRVIDHNRGAKGERLVAACGISWWKRREINNFLWSPGAKLRIFRSASRALSAARAEDGALAVWPSRISPDLISKAKKRGVKLVRVEDGFVRSVGLGTNLVPPLSVIVDRRGIHFDPSEPSDLEHILANETFTSSLIERAARLRETIVANGISKYSRALDRRQPSLTRHARERRVVLVPGQVEDDMSVLAGGGGITSNLELLRRVRVLEIDSEIWWRPHPDVDAGHRKGFVPDSDALRHADRIVRDESMAELLEAVDGVHVLTSLAGFEALLRGRDVTCHGTPFYAGWGLTRDLGTVPNRRGRPLSLDELVAGVLVLYPRYLDPVTGLPCPPEILVQRMARGETPNRLAWIEPIRRAQGRFMSQLAPSRRKRNDIR